MKDVTQYVYFNLYGIVLRFESEQKDLIDFMKFFVEFSSNDIEVHEPQIYVNLKKNKPFSIERKIHKISRNIWLADSSVYISKIDESVDLGLKVSIVNNRMYIDAFWIEKKGDLIKEILKYRSAYNRHRLYRSFILIYYLIYFPYLYYLERFNNFYLLHASALEYKQKGIIITGLGGVGKTTFSLGSLFLNGCKILSDNLIFHDTKKIYSVPEPIALDPKITNILDRIEYKIIPKKIPSSYGRMFYQIKSEIISYEAIPKYLFWLQLGDENTIKPLKKEFCTKYLLSINLLARELRKYYVFAATIDLAFPRSLSPIQHHENLSQLLSNLDCFILRIKPGDDIKTVYKETIARVIDE